MDEMYLNEHKGIQVGNVFNVDTQKVLIQVKDETLLNSLKINDLIVFKGINRDEMLIGIINKITKRLIEIIDDPDEEPDSASENFCSVILVGTFFDKYGAKTEKKFKRVINTYPEINSEAYKADDTALNIIMSSLANSTDGADLCIGKYAINKGVPAILEGNNFFQRHACIVGSTGSGKSYTVANILEKAKILNYSNILLFDLHGEYNELTYCTQIKIGSGSDELKMPLWFFTYEEIQSLFIESSEGTSTNQRAVVVDYILKAKKEYIDSNMEGYTKSVITADTPIPFPVKELQSHLEYKNSEEIDTGEVYKTGAKAGQPKTIQGASYNKLTNLLSRLQTKIDDKKYAFIFDDEPCNNHNYLKTFIEHIMDFNNNRNIKVIDVSEVPSDVLPIIIGTLTRIIYDIQFWMTPAFKR